MTEFTDSELAVLVYMRPPSARCRGSLRGRSRYGTRREEEARNYVYGTTPLSSVLSVIAHLHRHEQSGSLCSMLYPAPGNILDWMYGDVGVTFAYAAHLRDTGTYGYALPSEWIRPVGEETATMLEYLAAFIK